MKQFRLDNLGGLGINADLPPVSLPPGVWSGGQNVRCESGRVRNFAGHSEVSACSGTYYYLLPTQSTTTYYWYFCSAAAIKEWNGSTCTDRTRTSGAYTGSATDRWNGGVLHGIPILNNGVDSPQSLSAPGAGNFEDLKWDATTTWATQGSGNTAKVIRGWRNFLVALDTTESGTRNPHVFRLSDAADPGSVPSTWDETDTSALTYKTTFSETSGRLIDAVPLGQDLIVYKEDAIYRVSFVGFPDVLQIDLITDKYGLRAQGCAVDIGGAHVVLGHNGVYLHNGSNITPLAYGRISESLFGNINGDQYEQSFLTHNPLEHEVWVCYPGELASVWTNKAWVLNHKDDTWYPRDLPSETAFITPGVDLESSGDETYATTTDTYETVSRTYGDRGYNPTVQTLHGVAGSKLLKFDQAAQFDGADPECYVERTGIAVNGTQTFQTFTAVYPEIRATDSVKVSLGVQEHPTDDPSWEGPYDFDPNSERKVDVLSTGALVGIKVSSDNGAEWELTGLTFEYEDAGLR